MNDYVSKIEGQDIEIFPVVKQVLDNGQTENFSAHILDNIAAEYNARPPEDHSPVILGHSPAFDDTAPSYGWVASLNRKGKMLTARLRDVDPLFAELALTKRYPNRSVYMTAATGTRNWQLRHLAFLGAAEPRYKGMKELQASANDGNDDGNDLKLFGSIVSDSEGNSPIGDKLHNMTDIEKGNDKMTELTQEQKDLKAAQDKLAEDQKALEASQKEFEAKEQANENKEQELIAREAKVKAGEVVNELVASAKIHPNQKDKAIEFAASLDDDGRKNFKELVASFKPIVDLGEQAPTEDYDASVNEKDSDENVNKLMAKAREDNPGLGDFQIAAIADEQLQGNK